MVLEIILIIGICVAVFFAVRYIVRQRRQHGCVGCSMAKQCSYSPENCGKNKQGGAGND